MGASNNDDDMISSINVTPLVDVVLVLLVVLMVSVPVLMKNSLKLSVPKAEASSGDTGKNQIEISLLRNNQIMISGEIVSFKELREVLNKQAIKRSKKLAELVILIRADKDSSYGKFSDLVDLIKQEGIKKIGIVTDKKTAQ